RILITGASGFVGSSFCLQHASRADVEIRGLGRREMDLPGYIRADLTQPLRLDWRPEVVIHAAARSSPWGSLKEFRRQNVLATKHVLEFCEAQKVRKLVYISSSSVFYREGDQTGMTEDTPIGPQFVNAYAQTKYEGEEVARDFPGAWCVLRPRAVFGPRDTVLFPRLLRAARQGRMVSITRPGPPAVGDLIYIDTLCDYMLRAALDPTVTGEFNLTNHEPVEIQAFIADIFARLGLPPVKRAIPKEKAMRVAWLLEKVFGLLMPWQEPPITRFGVEVLSSSKTFDTAKSLRGLGPPSVGLEEGVRRFIEWQKQHPDT
ncbi:MAG: NAD-dependent epimerase/dehydratase family protein, partial [Prosthecobacter sp.]|nr:NAD-dependent epimerase/dehydratase family protein [Prosthecobacter sp.]